MTEKQEPTTTDIELYSYSGYSISECIGYRKRTVVTAPILKNEYGDMVTIKKHYGVLL